MEVPDDMNLSFLLEHERDTILKVLQKDEKLRKREEKRIRKLKNELLEIKRKGSRSAPRESGERQCGRCLKTLGLIFDRGELCDDCGLRVCSECRVSATKRREWRCNVCAKISELKVVTGEWFLEERSKRFEHKLLSSDVVKQTILSSPTATVDKKSADNLCLRPESGRSDTPKSSRRSKHLVDGLRKRGRMKMDKVGSRPLRSENGFDGLNVKSASDGDAHSVRSVHSAPSQHANSGSMAAFNSYGTPTALNNNRRSQTPDRSSTCGSNRRVRQPDGAESVYSFHSSSSAPESKTAGNDGKSSGAPIISVSRASVSSDHSRSEMDLSAAGSEASDDAFSFRSRSVLGLNDTEFCDQDAEEDIDALMSAHSQTAGHRLNNAASMPSTPASERRWGFLNVPDSDAETSSISSMMSMYSETGDYGNARVSGEILLNISYSYKTGALNVMVKECHNLATGDERRQRTDAYVKTYLLPDMSRQSKRKTSVKANSINPVFNENLRYVISHSQLETRTLQVSVWHHDRFGHNSFLGEVELTFDSWEFDSQIDEWFALQPKLESSMDASMQYKGELTVVLKYIPAEKNLMLPLDQVQVKKGFLKGKKKSSFTPPQGGMVELLVKGAKNLTAVKSGGTSDPFVKGYLLPDNNKSTKHKTAVERRTVNPEWKHTFTYCGLQPGDLNNVCLELTVWDKEALASNVFMGGVRLGAGTGTSYGNEVDWMDSYGEEQRLWQRMIENPEVPQECTLMLRSTMRKTSS
ncbi:synaptotagmin-like protein 5 isoform X1 [Entelurus aequoreus]|uniref:synaptotagmin-like protein 5 isoform X1 n=1 Tax=Entelurus aequoreus TaxID=161455 RepID=UPI002B1DB512|nr:synaptotagmin-like protein 5 isoform X1 [Entelurus aequoreus]XP_061924926.1 synaptotagmin-like protein 5 isoform X1 [Entelurus aequoreus]